MRIAVLLTVAALVCILAAMPAVAQTARNSAMGEIGVGLADDSTAFISNPAGLPGVTTFGQTFSPWPSRVGVVASVEADWDRCGAWYTARNVDQALGWGAGYWRHDFGGLEIDTLGGGFGMAIGDSGFSAGVNVINENQDVGMTATQNGADLDSTFFDIGVMYQRADALANRWRVGAVARDISDESGVGPWYDVGASVTMPSGLIVGVDLLDVTEEIDAVVNIGAEFPIPMTDFLVRAGAVDGDLTAGFGYRRDNWEFAASYQNLDAGDETAIGLSACF